MDIVTLCDAYDGSRAQFKNIVSEALIVLRDAGEQPLTYLARELKISRGTVSRWGSGHSAPAPLGRRPAVASIKALVTRLKEAS